MNVTFKINSVEKTAAELGIVSAKISRKCSANDELSLVFSSDCDTSSLLIGDTIEVFSGDIRKFYGHIERLPISLAGKAKVSTLTARNAWAEMDEIVYQQPWTRLKNGVETTVYRSKVLLGPNEEEEGEEHITVGDQLRDIVNYAISCGAKFILGEIDIDSKMLSDEAQDLSCSQAILRVLKWSPNAVAFFDYSKSGLPVLNILKRTSINRESIELSSESILNISITSRPDLVLDGVAVKYERENLINGFTHLEVFEENYPENIDSNAPKVLVMSVDLDGRRSTCRSYKIVCKTIQLNSRQWWKDHVPSLENQTFEILESSISDSTYKRELVEGSIVAAMNFKTRRVTATALMRFTTEDGAQFIKSISTKLLSTNGFTGTYQVWKTSQYPEQVPQGLAQAIYESSNEMLYEGSAKIFGLIANDFIGKRLNINSSEHPEWEAINSTVVSTEEDLAKGITILKFGPPKHLYPDQITELFRINRTRKVTGAPPKRKSSKLSSKKENDHTTEPPVENSSEGEINYERLIIKDKEGNSGVIDLNSDDVETDDIAKMRKIYLCHNGYLATAKVLMTEPKNEES